MIKVWGYTEYLKSDDDHRNDVFTQLHVSALNEIICHGDNEIQYLVPINGFQEYTFNIILIKNPCVPTVVIWHVDTASWYECPLHTPRITPCFFFLSHGNIGGYCKGGCVINTNLPDITQFSQLVPTHLCFRGTNWEKLWSTAIYIKTLGWFCICTIPSSHVL